MACSYFADRTALTPGSSDPVGSGSVSLLVTTPIPIATHGGLMSATTGPSVHCRRQKDE